MEDWKNDIPEDIRSNFDRFKNVGTLAASYVEQNKLLSQKFSGLDPEDDFATYAQKTGKFQRLPDEYKPFESASMNELGKKYALHPERQFKPFIQEYEKLQKEQEGKAKTEKMDVWKIKNEKMFSAYENKDELIGRGLGKLGVSREAFEAELGDHAHHPQVVKALLTLGEAPAAGAKPPDHAQADAKAADSVTQSDKANYAWAREQIRDHQGPYYNKNHPSHEKVRERVIQYSQKFQEKSW